jgi:hypothetical protein
MTDCPDASDGDATRKSGQPPPAPAEVWGGRTTRYYEAMRAWGSVGSAVSAIVAVSALLFGLWQFDHVQEQWKRDMASRAIFQGNWDQPFIARHCLRAVLELPDQQLVAVHDRQDVKLAPDQAEWVRRCFADLDAAAQKAVYRGNNTLSSKGAATLAQRANHSLDKDELIANFILQGMGDETLLLQQYRQRICDVDKPIIDKLRRIGREERIEEFHAEYEPILEFERKGFCAKTH